jgi:NAD(P)-dependent dehydrogenase (short-subunit alcohol dehydrogenase family)
MDSLAGRNAVITGGGSGIGRGLVLELARAGANVVVADIEADAAGAVAEEASAIGVNALPIATDVSDISSVQALADRAFAELGQVHVLCNNAGVLLMAPVQDLIVDDWTWLFSVNVMGVVHGIHSFLPRMREQGEGHIVNTSSVAAFGGGGVYGASKAAVLSISETLHDELRDHGIGVTVLCPAAISSRINSSQRNRPAATGRKLPEPFAGIVDFGLDPAHVGRRAVQAIQNDDLYVFIYPQGWTGRIKAPADERFARIGAAMEKGET